MPLTEKQSERLAELEAEVEGGIGGMPVPLKPDNLPDDSVWKLAQWAEVSHDRAPALAKWIHAVAVQEIYRRGNRRPIEAQIPRLPVEWKDSEVADALEASWGLVASNLDKALDDFLQNLAMTLAVQAGARLRRTNG